jgi:multidrug efflux pump subunit AcrA (membrane-fusion protein)
MKRAIIAIVIIVAVLGAVYFLRIRGIEQGRLERESKVSAAEGDATVPVRVESVITGDVERLLRYTGTVESKEEVDVYSKISGRIMERRVVRGDRVSKGQVIAIIDPEITGQRFEPFEVTAPLTGKVSMVYLDPGTYINQMQPIVRVIDDSSVKVMIGVLEKDYHLVKEGIPVRMVFDALPGETTEARITNRSPVVNPRTGTSETEIMLTNREGMLKAGMFARVEVITEIHIDAVLMPLAATLTEVLPGRGVRVETAVFVVAGDTGEERNVVLGLAGPTHYEVLEGLAPGEQVVVLGQNLLSDGARVSIAE